MFKKILLLLVLTAAAIGLRVGYDYWRTPAQADMLAAELHDEESNTLVPSKEQLPLTLAPVNAAPIVMVEHPNFDGKDLLKGELCKAVFEIKNTGVSQLEIRAKSTCGCTAAKYDHFIEPGKTGKVEAILNTSSLRGKVQKRIAVETNDPKKPKLDLTIAANIRPGIDVPSVGSPVLALRFNETAVKDYQVNIYEHEPVEIKNIECSVPHAQARLEPASIGDGKNFQVKVTVGKEAPAGRSEFTVILHTTSKRDPTVSIRVFCEKGILVMPSSLTFIPQQGSGERMVSLQKRDAAVHIRKITTDDARLEVKQESTKTGNGVLLRVNYRGDLAEMTPHVIKLETDDPHQPLLEIPVNARTTMTTASALSKP